MLNFRENHFEDHIVERTALRSELIRDVQGQLVFEEEQPRVWPINHFPDQQINSASSSLVQKHSTAFPTERILKQVIFCRFDVNYSQINSLHGVKYSYFSYFLGKFLSFLFFQRKFLFFPIF